MNNRTHVVILSQQSLFRQGIEHCLNSVDDIKVSGNAEISETLLSHIDTAPPDVALLDIDAAPEISLNFARKIKQRLPNIGIVVLSSAPDDAQVFMALKAQASAYMSKEVTAEQLVEVIRRVARGEHPINESLTTCPRVAEQVLQQFQELSWRNEAAVISPLTPRENEILNYIAQGFLNKQIAAQLEISEQTIKNHVTSILRKLNANARTEAVVVAIRQGLISIN